MTLIGRCCHCRNDPEMMAFCGRDVADDKRGPLQGRTVDFPAMNAPVRVKTQAEEDAASPLGVIMTPANTRMLVLDRSVMLDAPPVSRVIEILDAGRTVLVLGEYRDGVDYSSLFANQWFTDIGSSIQLHVYGRGETPYVPPRVDNVAVGSGGLMEGVETYYYADCSAPIGGGTAIAYQSGGPPLIVVDQVLNGRVIYVADRNALIQGKNDLCGSERFLANVYWDSFTGHATRCDRVGMWTGHHTNDWQFYLPDGYTEVSVANDADFETPGMGVVFMGYTFSGGFNIPSSYDGMNVFLQQGGTVVLTLMPIGGGASAEAPQIISANNLLAGVGAVTRVDGYDDDSTSQWGVSSCSASITSRGASSQYIRGGRVRMYMSTPNPACSVISAGVDHQRWITLETLPGGGRVIVIGSRQFFTDPAAVMPLTYRSSANWRIIRNIMYSATCSESA